MQIEFASSKLRKRCEDKSQAVRAWGEQQARKVLQRLAEIQAAENIAELCKVPGAACHRLKAERDGQFAVYLVHPFRLVFEPTGDESLYKDGTSIIAARVTRVKILEVVDYHD